MQNLPTFRGFTLVELLVAMSVAMIIATLGVPSMQRFIERNRLKTATEKIVGDLKYARSEAIKQNSEIFVSIQQGGPWCLGLDDTAYAIHIAERVVAEGWSVRQVEDAVKSRVGQAAPRRTSIPRPRPAAIIELEDRLGERLGTAVKIDHGKRGGKVSIKYSSLDDLERIYRLLN